MNEMLPRKLRLNGRLIGKEECSGHTFLVGHGQDGLVKEVYDFLKQWFDDYAYIEQNTSGSTGPPKTILIPKLFMVNSARMTNAFFGLHQGCTGLLCLSPQFIAGKMMVIRAMTAGFNLITTNVSANPIYELTDRVDFAAMIPMQVSKILRQSPDKISLIEKLIIGGSGIDATLETTLQDFVTSCWHTYGMTETISHIALRMINGPERSDWFVPFEGIRLSTDDRECLMIDAPMLCEGQLQTNDLVVFDNKGRFQVIGRADDVIITAGHKIHPALLERKISPLISFPFVISSQPHAESGSEIVLVIAHEYPIGDLFRLWKKLDETLNHAELPRSIVFASHLPTLDSGKTDRKRILTELQN